MFIIYLLVLVLNKVEFLDPIFGGLHRLFENCHPNNKTIFSVIKDEDLLQNAIKVVKEEVGYLDDPGAGILFTVPINSVMGLTQNNNQ